MCAPVLAGIYPVDDPAEIFMENFVSVYKIGRLPGKTEPGWTAYHVLKPYRYEVQWHHANNDALFFDSAVLFSGTE